MSVVYMCVYVCMYFCACDARLFTYSAGPVAYAGVTFTQHVLNKMIDSHVWATNKHTRTMCPQAPTPSPTPSPTQVSLVFSCLLLKNFGCFMSFLVTVTLVKHAYPDGTLFGGFESHTQHTNIYVCTVCCESATTSGSMTHSGLQHLEA
jgi:hypothetical protein